MRGVTNASYLLAVLAINFTLFRPSPVDILFVASLALSLLSGQNVTRNIFIFLILTGAWVLSMFASSIGLIDDPDVSYLLVKISFAVSIGVCSALVSTHWTRRDLERFLRFFLLSTCIASALGSFGYLTENEALTWDGRAKGFLDDPNMYGAFLLTGLLACMYMLWRGGRRWLYAPAMALLLLGLTLSFSRAAIMSFALWGGLYYLFLNRANLPRAIAALLLVAAAGAVAFSVAALSIDGLAERLGERSTIAKDYDLGHGGRYNRYVLSIGYIVENPLGLGLLQWDKLFDEPIHNIWLSSFMNYGWVAGIAFTLLVMFSVAISRFNYATTRDPLVMLVFFAWIAVLSCALLHEAERWRHLWLLTGLVWGLNMRHFAFVRPKPAGIAAPERASPYPAHGEARPA